jgi:hypothetical protein
MLVRGATRSRDIDEFTLLLQPIKDTRRNYRGITGKLIRVDPEKLLTGQLILPASRERTRAMGAPYSSFDRSGCLSPYRGKTTEPA